MNIQRLLLPLTLIGGSLGLVMAYLLWPFLRTLRLADPIRPPAPDSHPSSGDPLTAESLADALRQLGMSDDGRFGSTGVREHLRRLGQGTVSAPLLAAYVRDLQRLSQLSAEGGMALPADYWDVKPQGSRGQGFDEYSMARLLAGASFESYVRLLGQSYQRAYAFREQNADDAVTAALDLLRYSVDYVRSGGTAAVMAGLAALPPESQAIFLWQRLVAGTTRSSPILKVTVFSHGIWGRHNVVEMWRFRSGAHIEHMDFWGMNGLHQRFIGDPTNNNQIEHLVISAVMQITLGMPVLFLNLLEDAQWILQQAPNVHRLSDQAVNNAVAYDLKPRFNLAQADAVIDYVGCMLHTGADAAACAPLLERGRDA